jgi:hypothetical protein
MYRKGIGYLGAMALVAAAAGSAEAECNDSPRPGVDWHGCSKSDRIMAGYDFHGALVRMRRRISRATFSTATPLVMLRAYFSELLTEMTATRKSDGHTADVTGATLVSMLSAETEDISGFAGDAFAVPLLSTGTILYVALRAIFCGSSRR